MKNILIIFFGLLWYPILSQHIYPQASGGSASYDVISPAQLTAAADDWAPTGYATAELIRVSGDDQFRIISGINSSAGAKILTLTNVGSFGIYITKEDPASTAANRFNIPTDLGLYPNQSLTFFYDPTSLRWRLLNPSPNRAVAGRQYTAVYAQTGSVTAGDYDAYTFAATVTTGAPDASLPRRTNLSTGVSATAVPSISHKGASTYLGKTSSTPTGNWTRVSWQLTSSLSNGTNTYFAICGLPAAITSSNPDGAYFKYNDAVNGGKWQCVTRTAGAETTIDSGVTVAINTTYDMLVLHRPDNSVAFFIDDVFVGESTTNVHDGFAFNSVGLVKTVGTTARTAAVLGLEYLESRR